MQELSATAQDYVKVIFNALEWQDGPVTTKQLAQRLGVAPSTVSENVRKLVDQGLLTHEAYGSIELTAAGHLAGAAMVRRHRLIETFLVEHLGYAWDEVHDEAEVLEHACSDRMINALDAFLGFPKRDPHGDPIPSVQGEFALGAEELLSQAAAGTYHVVRISDADPELLRYFAEIGLGIGTPITVLPAPKFAGGVYLKCADQEITLNKESADAVWVHS